MAKSEEKAMTREELLAIIEQAAWAGQKQLNLARRGISELPAEIGQLTKLETLDLSGNRLKSLPESIGLLTKLQELNLCYNKLKSLPESIGQLTNLQKLDLHRNQLTSLPESIGQLANLKVLNLGDVDGGNLLTELPESIGKLTNLRELKLGDNQLTSLPEAIGKLVNLEELDLWLNRLTGLPPEIGQLTKMKSLNIYGTDLTSVPSSIWEQIKLTFLSIGKVELADAPSWIWQQTNLEILIINATKLTILPSDIGQLTSLTSLLISDNRLTSLPPELGRLTELSMLFLQENQLTSLPSSLAQLEKLSDLYLDDNPLNPELAEAYKQGLDAVKAYLRAKAAAQIILNEAKLILVGEGEVGKTCLLGALRGDPFVEGLPTTHGIEIKPIRVVDSDTQTEITFNGWDFGGQRVYRPTHQLFFSSPAVYLVVWKPREGPQQGFVKEWIKLIKHREPEAKILVVATHGGPKQRQPDIDRQELWDLFGKDTVLDFFHVDSKPDKKGNRRGINELKKAIARVAVKLPEMGRTVPKSWQDARESLQKTKKAYQPLENVIKLCRKYKIDDEQARLFVTISHRLGHLIHYQHDPTLRDIVVLKPDWLATAISFVLDDKETRKAHGLVRFSRLSQLWNDQIHPVESRYPANLHPIFLRLMERFDLSYRVAGLPSKGDSYSASLIAQLVPDTRPKKDLEREWPADITTGDIQQVQICRIVDEKGQSATAEGLFYQLIVRMHKYSLGRENYYKSVHWQRGLVLDDDYNGRALVEHFGNDVRITVRAPYPERFLAMLTSEVKYLVESFWEGLRCVVMVPCIEPCGKHAPGTGLFEVQKLIESKRRSRPEYPCPVCDEWQDIDCLLRNAPAARSMPTEELIAEFVEMKQELVTVRKQLVQQHGRFDRLDIGVRRILSKVDDGFTGLMQAFTDEAKEGPRLFSLVPADRSKFNPKQWTSAKFRLTLWCEHSRLPLPSIDGKDSKKGIYEIELTRDWFKKAAPFLKVLTGTLSLVLPVASSGIKLALDDTAYKVIEEQLDFGTDVIDATLEGSEKVAGWLSGSDMTSLEYGEAIRAQGATLRELHALLKAKDPGFDGLVRVMNKRQEFLWVHPQFEKEY